MRIAYVGQARGTSLHRARALERCGHTVVIVDPWSWLPSHKWIGRWIYYTGALGFGLLFDDRIYREVHSARPDFIWVDQGEFLGPSIIKNIRNIRTPVVNYTIDDPFGGRDRLRFRNYLKALPFYDVLAVCRDPNMPEALSRGARRVLRVWRSADEQFHRPRSLTTAEINRFGSEVAFIGTWMPERGPFLAALIKKGVPLSIWGDRWSKAKEWPILRPNWRGPTLDSDTNYAASIMASRICIGLLSKGNRDLHTQRSLEIPALGGLLCAERTSEHLALYKDGEEAVFWDDADECAAMCLALLADEPKRQRIAAAGHDRALRNGWFNERVVTSVLEAALHDQGDEGTLR